MIRAILWDNDGVLVDTEGLYFQAGREVLATQGVELPQEDFVEQSLQKGQSVFDLLP
ncbi:MAG: HAD family phosphatase, partial [Gemmatimonadetes bacterium]|nr:HAD family phosphatase [Gemmatimonadota bacterium]